MLSEQQQRIMGYFIEEAKDHLNTIEQGLVNLQSTIADSEMVHEVFRAAHSVKGGAAMLGLNSIQHTAHRLEDYFKVLKECPQVRVDQKLETLFLRVYDTLQDQVDHLQGPFGLTDDKAQEAMAVVEPVFTELNQHLIALVEQAGGTPPEDVELTSVSVPQPVVTQPHVAQPVVAEESALRFIFQNDVPARLREMLQLFKQAESIESREQLQQCCRVLAQPGEQFNLVGWCELLKVAQRAIANSDNAYRTLAPIIIKDVKRAQELVLSSRSTEISACEELRDLLPFDSLSESEEEQILESDLVDLLGSIDSDDGSFVLTDSTPTDSNHLATDTDLPAALFATETFAAETFAAEATEVDWFTEMPTQDEIGETILQNGHEAELNFDLEFEQISSAANHSDDLDLSFIDRLDEEPLPSGLGERNGPEVGAAELNSLADLFEGELPDLGLTWQEEEVISSVAPDQVESQLENSGDFFDLLDQDNSDDFALDEAQEDDLSGLLNAATEATHQSNDSALSFQPSVDSPANDFSFGEVNSTDSESPFDFELPELTPPDSDDMAMFFFTEEQFDTPIATANSEKSEDTAVTSGFQNLDELFAGVEVDELSVDDPESFDRLEAKSPDSMPESMSDDGAVDEILDEMSLDDYEILSEETQSELLELQANESITLEPENLNVAAETLDFGSDFGNESVTLDDAIVNNLGNTDEIGLSLVEDGAETAIEDSLNLEFSFEGEDESEDSSDFNTFFESEDSSDAIESDLNVLFGAEIGSTEITDELNTETASDFDALNDLFAEDYSGEIENTEFEHTVDSISTSAIDETLITDTEDTEFNLDFPSEEPIHTEGQDSEQPFFESLLASEVGFEQIVEQATEIIESVDVESVDVESVDTELTNESININGDEAEAIFSFESLEFDSLENTTEPSLEETHESLNDIDFDSSEEAFGDLADTFIDELNESDVSSNDILEIDVNAIDSVSHSEVMPEIGLEAVPNGAELSDAELSNLEDNATSNTDFDLFVLDENEALTGVEATDNLFADVLELESEPVELQVDSEAIEATQTDFADLEFMLEDSLQDISPLQDISDIAVKSENITTETIALDDEEFADLEAMLEDELPLPVAASSSVVETDEFADLEALLGDDLPVSAPPSPATIPAPAKTDDEFGDLEALLQDTDQKLGVGSSPVRNSASVATRRPARRNVIADQTMRVSVKHLDNLNNLVGEMVVNRNSLEQTQERLRQFLDNLLYQVQQLSDVGQRMRDLYERSLLESSLLASRRSYQLSGNNSSSSQTSHATGASFDALEMDKFTGFHTLSQEMIELIVRVRESASDIDFVVEESDQVTRNFRQITTQLQEGLTRSRMVPFAQTADRLPRGVRDNAIKYGKQAELVIEGRDTLIDKMIVEQLYDPMTHLVNNAIAHGIETPQERIASGKPPTGRITIRTFHQGNQTVISVSDDGAGINTDAVKSKAVAKRLITPAEAEQMSRLETYDLLFHHGFSTADTVDDLRGRGVGLDVVRNNLSEIRGSISIDSAIGKGSTFTIRLPLTLSISKALCCISNRARIAFPMDGVEDMLDVPKDRVCVDEQGQPCIQWRDVLLPFQPLSDLLKYNRVLGRGSVYGGNQEDDMLSIVVLRSAGNYLALQVDQVLGEQEIVIKQLEGPAPKPVGVAGATVLGDGRIMPIADVLELIDLSQGRIRREAGNALWETSGDQLAQDATALKTDPTVLIVDDSITVRELLSMTFNKVGYRVEQARDGQEAWEKLRAGLPCDLVFCDIEMPRMDGLELLSRLQKDPNLCHIPIAMLTSRGADRHRQMAVQLGAKGYFTKPYLEEMLLDAAQRMLKGEVLVTNTAG